MAEFIKVRGLTRQGNGVRVNKKMVKNTTTRVFDLDDAVTRRDIARHATLGQLIVVGDTDYALAATGAVVTPGTTTTISVSAGSLKVANPGGTTSSVTIAAVANTAVAANASGVDRTDIVQVHTGTGAATVKTGNAATLQTVAPDASNITIATVKVPSPLGSSASYTITDVSPRL